MTIASVGFLQLRDLDGVERARLIAGVEAVGPGIALGLPGPVVTV
jgi:hypothetical protein